MAENSAIEWTDHTFNPWWGCTKLSHACTHCYAETWAKRVGFTNLWGPKGERRMFGDKHWAEPLKWNAAAERAGVRKRVFCASMADVFENHPAVGAARVRLFELIEQTPQLDWLLLTKRPENMLDFFVPSSWDYSWPTNVWAGTTVEDQEQANERIPLLRRIPARVRFLSCEPLLGPLDDLNLDDIHWVIAGGESGPKARPAHPAWFRSLRDQCAAAGVPFLFKQWGEWAPVCAIDDELTDRLYHPAPARSPEALRRCKVDQLVMQASGRIFPLDEWSRCSGENPATGDFAHAAGTGSMQTMRIGKKVAGRLLDGVQHDGVPA